MTKQMMALLMIAEYPYLRQVLMPSIDIQSEEFHIEKIQYGTLSGGQKTAVSWAWCIWKDCQIPTERGGYGLSIESGARDPISGFGALDKPLQQVILKSLLLRHS